MPTPLARGLADRLFALSPRAFELLAGDLLVYLGLERVAVTRYAGDGGIDATADLPAAGGLLRLPAGVQVKRQRQAVGRPQLDAFVGALAGRFPAGLFVTTARFSGPALRKAAGPVPVVAALDGDRLVGLLLRHALGVAAGDRLDEAYFAQFELQAGALTRGRTSDAERPLVVMPAADLISARALSYLLRVDADTVRDWIARGRLVPDRADARSDPAVAFFRRDRVEAIRADLGARSLPATDEAWRAEFLAFATRGRLTTSYKPVLLAALLALADRDGRVRMAELAAAFRAYYQERRRSGLPAERDGAVMARVAELDELAVRSLIIKYPLDRFIIQGYLAYAPADGVVRFRPELWRSLRHADVLALRVNLDDQLARYFAPAGR